MGITKGNNTIDIPNWALFIGAIILDNVVVNVCNTICYNKRCNTIKNEGKS